MWKIQNLVVRDQEYQEMLARLDRDPGSPMGAVGELKINVTFETGTSVTRREYEKILSATVKELETLLSGLPLFQAHPVSLTWQDGKGRINLKAEIVSEPYKKGPV